MLLDVEELVCSIPAEDQAGRQLEKAIILDFLVPHSLASADEMSLSRTHQVCKLRMGVEMISKQMQFFVHIFYLLFKAENVVVYV